MPKQNRLESYDPAVELCSGRKKMFTQTKVTKLTDKTVLNRVRESNGSEWMCFFESGKLAYKPNLMFSIDFAALVPSDQLEKVTGGVMYGAKQVGTVELIFPMASVGLIEVLLTGDVECHLEGVQSLRDSGDEDLATALA
jgi:hypothetical protein